MPLFTHFIVAPALESSSMEWSLFKTFISVFLFLLENREIIVVRVYVMMMIIDAKTSTKVRY